MKEMLNKAIVLMVNTFDGDFDKGGNPYSLHCLSVMHKLRTKDLELMQIALLHDIIEDHGDEVTYSSLREMGFSNRVIDGVRCLTKVPGESYAEYKIKVMSNNDAIKVKMADLQHNSDIRRLKGVTEKDIKRTVKYHEFYLELETAAKNTCKG
jgi:(p)ppGpp synthase/HD superfamily hydrolase